MCVCGVCVVVLVFWWRSLSTVVYEAEAVMVVVMAIFFMHATCHVCMPHVSPPGSASDTPQPYAHMSIHACIYIYMHCYVVSLLCHVMPVFFLFVTFWAQLAVSNRRRCVARPSYPPSFFCCFFSTP